MANTYLSFLITLTVFFVMNPGKINCQTSVYAGLEVGESRPYFDVVSSHNTLRVKPIPRLSFVGLSIGVDLDITFRIETGFVKNNYYESYEILDSSFVSSRASEGLTVYQIPFRVKAQGRVLKSVFKNRLFIYSIVGYHLGINTDFGEKNPGHRNLSWTVNGSTFTYNEESVRDYSFQQTFGLVEAGGGLDFYFGEKFSVFSNYSYTFGLRQLIEINIQYQINQGETKWGRISSNGSYQLLKFGVRYKI